MGDITASIQGGVLDYYDARSLRIWRLRRYLILQSVYLFWFFASHGRSIVKRLFDLVVSSILILLTAPVMALTALAIKLDSPGPVFFRQQRSGRWGKPFACFKFRSMYIDAEARRAELEKLNEASGPVFKMRNDPRVTRVGKFIRKLSIDELPQFFNVFNGTLSLVGPRPPLPSEVAKYTLEQRQRLAVKPGITCIWQVSGRSNVDFDRWVRMDVQYIEGESLLMDIKLLLRTVPAVFFGKGAY